MSGEAPQVIVDMIGGLCPVQAEGSIDGWPFYFRARGEHWSLEIAEPGFDPGGEPVWESGGAYGSWPEAGYMPEDEARGFIAQAAVEFRAWRAEHPEVDGSGRRTAEILREQVASAYRRASRAVQAQLAAEREVVRLRRLLGLNPAAGYVIAGLQVQNGVE